MSYTPPPPVTATAAQTPPVRRTPPSIVQAPPTIPSPSKQQPVKPSPPKRQPSPQQQQQQQQQQQLEKPLVLPPPLRPTAAATQLTLQGLKALQQQQLVSSTGPRVPRAVLVQPVASAGKPHMPPIKVLVTTAAQSLGMGVRAPGPAASTTKGPPKLRPPTFPSQTNTPQSVSLLFMSISQFPARVLLWYHAKSPQILPHSWQDSCNPKFLAFFSLSPPRPALTCPNWSLWRVTKYLRPYPAYICLHC